MQRSTSEKSPNVLFIQRQRAHVHLLLSSWFLLNLIRKAKNAVAAGDRIIAVFRCRHEERKTCGGIWGSEEEEGRERRKRCSGVVVAVPAKLGEKGFFLCRPSVVRLFVLQPHDGPIGGMPPKVSEREAGCYANVARCGTIIALITELFTRNPLGIRPRCFGIWQMFPFLPSPAAPGNTATAAKC